MKFASLALVFVGARGALDKFGYFGDLSDGFKLGSSKFDLDMGKLGKLDLGLFGKGKKEKRCFADDCTLTLDRITWAGNTFTPEEGNNVFSAFHTADMCGYEFDGTFLEPQAEGSTLADLLTTFSMPQKSTVRVGEKTNGSFSASVESFLVPTLAPGDNPGLAGAGWVVGTEGTVVDFSASLGNTTLEGDFLLAGCDDLDAVSASVFCLSAASPFGGIFPITQTDASQVNLSFEVSPVGDEQKKRFNVDKEGTLVNGAFSVSSQDLSAFCQSPSGIPNGDLLLGSGIEVTGCCGAAAAYFPAFDLPPLPQQPPVGR
uniref:Uncharacterized protein n=1 Tax=Chromera velia CCMP2878 TaxID=1169474 RepID=A0A0G4GGN1_9ALVE|mmetsp:Transcript_48057/g.94917  ORF Transcript_48057/g.94917 Transcript_48057/m.94917 type:complete len:316 (+) Transcript_48057:153-1100(+)|eukprot:Cvel_21816.t1-p1 / transcript=Cvel_21816.t1 / gene=Cvel_21816 / organism=Chromera_velia_CCMP2878 / gene_product=hypothetical protein / transcript_product=hypothetical protein / location=Cvel_scaffold2080:23402-25227(-) / protein_length=315 / sequence_SO=supercontig / SO=protein_coding / is_pseudo=false